MLTFISFATMWASVVLPSPLPSLLQLFGNGSTVVESLGLVPERSTAVDGAVTARGHTGVVSGYASVGAFVARIDEMIRFRPLPQGTFKAENIDAGRNRGVEVSTAAVDRVAALYRSDDAGECGLPAAHCCFASHLRGHSLGGVGAYLGDLAFPEVAGIGRGLIGAGF